MLPQCVAYTKRRRRCKNAPVDNGRCNTHRDYTDKGTDWTRRKAFHERGKRSFKYRDYINSDMWRDIRLDFIESDLPKRCFGCREPWGRGDHLHHRRYDNLGTEILLKDVVPLCPSCHNKVHQIQRERMKEGESYEKALRKATNIVLNSGPRAGKRYKRFRSRNGTISLE